MSLHNKTKTMVIFGISALLLLSACSARIPEVPEGYEEIDPDLEVTPEDVQEVLRDEDLNFAQSVPYEGEMEDAEAETPEDTADDVASDDVEDVEEYLPGYATEEDWKSRDTGSASYIWEPTVIVSVFIDEEEDVWTTEEKDSVLEICDIGYRFIMDTMEEEYNTDCNLIYDWKEDPELAYSIRLYESIPTYVTGAEEVYMNSLADEWLKDIPYRELCMKYDTTSIAFLYLIPHEGGSYSEMHCIEDTSATWHDNSFMYLQDIYSKNYEYETPTVYAHELLHLFGAEDFYKSARIYSEETYDALAQVAADDLMYSTFDKIGGVYTTYPDSVPRTISEYTAYLLGIGDDSVMKDIPELIRDKAACFPGSSKDRAFD